MSSRLTEPPSDLPQGPAAGPEEGGWQGLGPDDLAPVATLERLGEEAHVWAFPLALPGWDEAGQEALLSADERARADSFRLDRHRSRFVVGRATLRQLLGHYLEADPAGLRFAYGPAGKPAVAGPEAEQGLSFNLSNSGDWALLAVAQGRRLGIDLEWVRNENDLGAVARRFFAAEEVAALESYVPPRRAEVFCAIWTRKEALLKACGAGLSLPLAGFCVSADPAAPARLLSTAFRPEEVAHWSLMDVALGPPLAGAFRAALAIEGPLPPCRRFRLEP
jgi:4'-phosphopantetheinyl transferase